MKHVMIAGNEPAILKMEEQIRRDNYRISTILRENIKKHIQHNLPDLLLLETELVEQEDLHSLHRLTQLAKSKGFSVIVILESDSLKMQQLVYELGADDFIAKPFGEETLRRRVELWLEVQDYRKGSTEAEKFQDAISVSFAELVEFRDETTGGHIKNTTQYFRILMEEMLKIEEYKNSIPEKDVKDLLRSAPLHDIGKIGINDDILRKASSLDYHEFEYMKTHTTLGKQAFEKIIEETGGSNWLNLAKDMAYCHHERWDGTGYPCGLKGVEIPLYARILTIADVYDALTSRRTYKEAYSHKEAVEIILEGKGSLFDPRLVDLFVKANKRFEKALLSKQKNTE
ncbi:MAG: rpfG3 [Herbinix sp.]|jgi:putative two-component system response regulator|nr:rpfG3 [Herbinix sp.]